MLIFADDYSVPYPVQLSVADLVFQLVCSNTPTGLPDELFPALLTGEFHPLIPIRSKRSDSILKAN